MAQVLPNRHNVHEESILFRHPVYCCGDQRMEDEEIARIAKRSEELIQRPKETH